MLKVGLTGGVASGKSTVAQLFRELGAALIDTDVVAREAVEPGTPGLAAIRSAFGPAVVGTDGRLDRRRLRSLIFTDAAERARLDGILHPLIRERVLAELAALEKAGTAPYVLIAVPLLVETNFALLVDRVLVVDCPVETQIARLTARDGIELREARAMVAAQADRATRLGIADDVIDNAGEAAATRSQVQALDRRYRELATVCRTPAGRAE